MAPKRARRAAMTASAWALDWYNELPNGPCKLAVTRFFEETGRAGANPDEALTQSLAYAQQHFPEEVVLWTLDRGLVPNPWLNDGVQLGIRSSLLALRQLREERALAEQAATAALAEVPVQHADAVVPFSGVGHQLN